MIDLFDHVITIQMDRYFKKLSFGSLIGNTSSRSENSPTPLEEAQSPQQHTPST